MCQNFSEGKCQILNKQCPIIKGMSIIKQVKSAVKR